jgi:hypothetical protein
MNFRIANQSFVDVQIPLLWGQRAIIQDRKDRLSVIDLSEPRAKLEILGDEPAPGVTFEPSFSGFKILKNGLALYLYDPAEKRLESLSLGLPDCQVTPSAIRIGSNEFTGNSFVGYGVGLAVTPEGISVGTPLPSGLARLAV